MNRHRCHRGHIACRQQHRNDTSKWPQPPFPPGLSCLHSCWSYWPNRRWSRRSWRSASVRSIDSCARPYLGQAIPNTSSAVPWRWPRNLSGNPQAHTYCRASPGSIFAPPKVLPQVGLLRDAWRRNPPGCPNGLGCRCWPSHLDLPSFQCHENVRPS